MDIFAHSVQDQPEQTWEQLRDHSLKVARRAAGFAQPFNGDELAYLLGLTHDIGKAKAEFQRKLRGQNGAVTHSGEGALLLRERYNTLGTLLAACVAGHHSGLPDADNLNQRLDMINTLDPPPWAELPETPKLPDVLTGQIDHFELQFLVRMLFSCLVDADELETAAFYEALEGRLGDTRPNSITAAHRQAFDRHMAQFAQPESTVNRLRTEILSTVRSRAALHSGLFSLTVPTGGGKTLASLGFALDHALTHGMKRIIHVIPYTSVVEQTADIFTDVLGPQAVVEHHSSFDWDRISDAEDTRRLLRVTRNWDAPVVVTTAVQFFESLYAARKRRCVKLHNLAGSVIVIDEAQTMPLSLLRPCLAAIAELARNYGASVVLSTATQPAVTRAAGLTVPEALDNVRELAPDPPRLYSALRRTRVRNAGEMDDDALFDRISEAETVLVILGNRRHARAVFGRVQNLPGARHLSTTMTPDHRRHALAEVRADLKAKKPVRLIATSLVEAGVNISFPLVMRATAGLDSIAQAAGRCNREGEMRNLGEVIVFTPTGKGASPPEQVREMAVIGAQVMAAHPEDPLSEEAIADYFRRILWQAGPEALDAAKVGRPGGPLKAGILKEIAESGNCFAFRFASIADAFRMIDTGQAPVIIRGGRWGIPDRMLEDLQWKEGARGIAKALQPFVVNLPHHIRSALKTTRAASIWREDLFGRDFLLLDHNQLYDDHAGLRMDGFEQWDGIA